MKFNKTHLSIDKAEERGFIHRDYIAHCLRWSHIIKVLIKQHLYKTAKILDIGCGKEVPLAKTMYTSKMSPDKTQGGKYVGLDVNKLSIPEMLNTEKFPIELHGETNIATWQTEDKFDIIVCFEVLEHMPPQNVLSTLHSFKKLVKDENSLIFISTPNYNQKVGAASNHPNEMSYELMIRIFNLVGLRLESIYGTFASIKDYESKLNSYDHELFEKLRQYYDTNYLATIFAPLYPKESRNIMYVLDVKNFTISNNYPFLDRYSNNTDWIDIFGDY